MASMEDTSTMQRVTWSSENESLPVNLVKRVKKDMSPVNGNSRSISPPSSPSSRNRKKGAGRGPTIRGPYQKDGYPFIPKMERGLFACQSCSLSFTNRDALAMHMMDSVRNNGLCASAMAEEAPRSDDSHSCRQCGERQASTEALALHNICAHRADSILRPSLLDYSEYLQNLVRASLFPTGTSLLHLQNGHQEAPPRLEESKQTSEPSKETRVPSPCSPVTQMSPKNPNMPKCNSAPLLLVSQHETETLCLEETSPSQSGMKYECSHCKIWFAEQTMYTLHMGLHNRVHPFQCNMCGQECKDPLEFASHTLHF